MFDPVTTVTNDSDVRIKSALDQAYQAKNAVSLLEQHSSQQHVLQY